MKDQAAINVEEAARKGEGVDGIRINYFNGEGDLRVRIAYEVLAYAVDVFIDDGIFNELGGGIDLLGELLAEGDFTFERIKIGALANVTVADGVYVVLGILGMYCILLLNRLVLRSLGLRRRGSRRLRRSRLRRRLRFAWILTSRRGRSGLRWSGLLRGGRLRLLRWGRALAGLLSCQSCACGKEACHRKA